MTNGEQPANPVTHRSQDGELYYDVHQGLTKREMFAMAAMQGLCGNSIPGSHNRPEELIPEAIRMADLLLKQLSE